MFSFRSILFISGTFLFGLIILSFIFFSKHNTEKVFPALFIVKDGYSITKVAQKLKEEDLIFSESVFIISNLFFGGKVIKGNYYLQQSSSAFTLARDLFAGKKNARYKKFTIKERETIFSIAEKLEKQFNNFDKDKFIEIGLKDHGKFYPETYFFPEDEKITAEQAIDIFIKTFDANTKDLFNSYTGEFSKRDLIILASIVDLEAHDKETRKEVASVLYNRIEKNMPLQVDVSFLFINGKDTFSLNRNDLRLDDPNNTYKHKGIPQDALTNPTIESIDAVINPAKTNFLYFLADGVGKTYFSETYNEHLIKKSKYVDPIKIRK